MTKNKFLKLMLAALISMAAIFVGPPIDITIKQGPIMKRIPGQPPIIVNVPW